VYSAGLKLIGVCPDCGYTWGVNKYWRCTEVLNGIHKQQLQTT
jgi:hypothetical protein